VTVDIFQSITRAGCDERAFVLAAVGIASEISFDGLKYSLAVELGDATAALNHLIPYESERQVGQGQLIKPLPAPRVHGGVWIGAAAYGAVLVGIALAISNGLWPADAFERGLLDAGKVQSGQWWRAWTALTLHWDAAHLVANLGAGIWFGTLAARQLGSGSTWLLVVTGAATANLFDALFGPVSYRSAGASTAVFTALGLMAAHSWRSRFHLPQRWALRWAPLVAGVVLLGWFGSAGEGTDLVAHALGFMVGGALGITAAVPTVDGLLNRIPQWLTGLAAGASLAIAWACALA